MRKIARPAHGCKPRPNPDAGRCGQLSIVALAIANLGMLDLLQTFFGNVFIPPEVAYELCRPERPDAVREFMRITPHWLIVRAPLSKGAIPLLHAGETAAIYLAEELKADLILIDQAMGRKMERQRNLALAGTIGVLELAANQNLLDLRSVFEKLKQTDFWISHRLLDERLRIFESERKKHKR